MELVKFVHLRDCLFLGESKSKGFTWQEER